MSFRISGVLLLILCAWSGDRTLAQESPRGDAKSSHQTTERRQCARPNTAPKVASAKPSGNGNQPGKATNAVNLKLRAAEDLLVAAEVKLACAEAAVHATSKEFAEAQTQLKLVIEEREATKRSLVKEHRAFNEQQRSETEAAFDKNEKVINKALADLQGLRGHADLEAGARIRANQILEGMKLDTTLAKLTHAEEQFKTDQEHRTASAEAKVEDASNRCGFYRIQNMAAGLKQCSAKIEVSVASEQVKSAKNGLTAEDIKLVAMNDEKIIQLLHFINGELLKISNHLDAQISMKAKLKELESMRRTRRVPRVTPEELSSSLDSRQKLSFALNELAPVINSMQPTIDIRINSSIELSELDRKSSIAARTLLMEHWKEAQTQLCATAEQLRGSSERWRSAVSAGP